MIQHESPTRQNSKLLPELERKLAACLASGIDEKAPFEAELAAHQDYRAAVCVGGLVDALELALRTLPPRPGSEVLVPAFGAWEPVVAVLRAGLVPVFVDVDPETACLSPREAAEAVTPRTTAFIASSSDGRRAPVGELARLARKFGLHGIENATDTVGLGAPVEKLSLRVLSFPSSGPLGAPGPAAAILVDDRATAAAIREKPHVAPSPLDLALLRLKLPHLNAWTGMRRTVAAWYHRHLQPLVDKKLITLPADGAQHAWAAFSVRVPRYRDEIALCLRAKGIGVGLPAEKPLPARPEFHAYSRGGFPAAQALCHERLSLPIYPELTGKEFQSVVNSLTACTARLST